MNPRWLLGGMALVWALSCGGEVTELRYDVEQESSFERFRDEIHPILTLESSDGVARNCGMAGCHAVSIGGLQILTGTADDDINANFQQVAAKLDECDASDPDWPDSCILLSDPRTGSPDHPVQSFMGSEDCCYQIVRAWILDAENPETAGTCTCP